MINNLHLIKFAFRNVFRNKRRTLLTSIVVMTSVGSMLFMFGYMKGIIQMVIEDSIKLTGHINVQHPEYKLKQRMLSLTASVSNYDNIIGGIRKVDNVKTASGRIKFGGLIDFNENNEPGLGFGFDPKAEEESLKLKNSIIEGSYFSNNSANETVIGVEIAKKLDAGIGDVITVITSTAYGSMSAENFKVVGIADMLAGAFNRLFYISLPTAQYLLDMEDAVTEIVIVPEESGNLQSIKENVNNILGTGEQYEVKLWSEQPPLDSYLPTLNVFYVIIIGLFGLIASFSILNTMLMSVLERTREIGVLSAFGMRKNKILQIFLYESGFIGLLGGLMGAVVGGSGAFYLETVGLKLGKVVEGFPLPIRQTVYADVVWYHIVSAVLLGVFICLVAAYLPALKASRTEPTKALRTH